MTKLFSSRLGLSLACLAVGLFVLWTAPAAAQEQSASKRRAVVGEGFVEPPPPPTPEMVQDLRAYVAERLRKHFVTPADVFDPQLLPFEGLAYIRLTPEPAVPILAGNLAVYCGDLQGLAVMGQDGALTVWGEYGCRSLRMSSGPATRLAMGKDAPWLAALSPDNATIRMVDLKRCGPAGVWLRAKGKHVQRMVMSGNGDWLGVATAKGAVYAGPVLGPLKKVAEFEAPPMALGFSAYEGVLAAVSRKGEVVFWAMRPGRLAGTARIKGEFVKARFSRDILLLTMQEGARRAWDIVSRQFVEAEEPELKKKPRLELSDGRLYLQTGLTRWKKAVAMRQPTMMLYYSSSVQRLKLKDVDGETRYYDPKTGLPAEPAEAGDWRWLPEQKGGVYTVGEQEYRLTDLAYQTGDKALICRYVPQVGFFLWWENRVAHRSYDPHHGKLPARSSLLAGQAPDWIDLRKGRLP